MPPSAPAEIAAWADAVPAISAEEHSLCPWWIGALHDDPEAMRQRLASAAAKNPALPLSVMRRMIGVAGRAG